MLGAGERHVCRSFDGRDGAACLAPRAPTLRDDAPARPRRVRVPAARQGAGGARGRGWGCGMRFCLFYHSLVSDWNHGNAHFLRGVAAELLDRGHEVRIFEPESGWSVRHLRDEHGVEAIADFHRAFPQLRSETYCENTFDPAPLIEGADVVIAHEWTAPGVLSSLARHRARHGAYQLLFHDTHHRLVSNPDALAAAGLEAFDGVLAFGASLAERYRLLGWGRRVWVWHEAADTRVFFPREAAAPEGDLVWIGNWGDGERACELEEFLLRPASRLRLRARVHGVRYPRAALDRLAACGLEYGGWIPNYRVPDVFARFRVTVHVPRAPYAAQLPGIPTIRPFEALACGIPLISAPWEDVEELFRPGDLVMVRDGRGMEEALDTVLRDAEIAATLAANGLETIRARHTCAHRVEQLLDIVGAPARARPAVDPGAEGSRHARLQGSWVEPRASLAAGEVR